MPRLPDVEGGGEEAGYGTGDGAGDETVYEGGGVGVVAEGVGGRGRVAQSGEGLADGFVAPPVDAAEGDVAPHGEGQPAPQAGVALRADHVA